MRNLLGTSNAGQYHLVHPRPVKPGMHTHVELLSIISWTNQGFCLIQGQNGASASRTVRAWLRVSSHQSPQLLREHRHPCTHHPWLACSRLKEEQGHITAHTGNLPVLVLLLWAEHIHIQVHGEVGLCCDASVTDSLRRMTHATTSTTVCAAMPL